MKGQELRAAARARMARTGESYLSARAASRRRPTWWDRLLKRRPGIVYGVKTIHEKRGTTVLGYVGKTRQLLCQRMVQHGVFQPWQDLIVDSYAIKAGMFTDLGLWWAEVWRIVLRWPVYNYEWNRLNPRRIPKYVAAERHRSAACRAALRQLRRAEQVRPVRWPTNPRPAPADPFAETRW